VSSADRAVSRRALLGGGAVAIGGAVAGSTWYGVARGTGQHPLTQRWRERRGTRYFIAHRGAGDALPEHTLPAYEAALGWGADAVEISTSSTADGVLICMHDLTYDRTTTGKGVIHEQPSTVLTRLGVSQPQLGPKWSRAPLTPVPRLDDVLQRIGGRAVLCIEAKLDSDYAAVAAMIEKHGLRDSVIMKFFHRSHNIAVAKAAGYPVFVYLGGGDVSAKTISDAAAGLDRVKDCLVIPTTAGTGDIPDALVAAAVKTGVPTWVYPVHRRVEADHYFALGVSGVVTSSIGYSAQSIPPVRRDDWRSGAIQPGQLSRDPVGVGHAPIWRPDGALTLAGRGIGQHFLLLGQFGVLGSTGAGYNVQFEARWEKLPADKNANLTLAFACADDRYYQHRLGAASGYHATQRANGLLELYRHSAGSQEGVPLGAPAPTAAALEGQWMRFSLQVSQGGISWRRLGGALNGISVSVGDFHGGYLHIGRSSDDGALSFRNFTVA
jgi:glycerophosphoryl diester phosphodiesterase